jgi:hypothetical protein
VLEKPAVGIQQTDRAPISEDPSELLKDATFVAKSQKSKRAQNVVEAVVGEVELVGIHQQQLDVSQAAGADFACCARQHRFRGVDPYQTAGSIKPVSDREEHRSGPGGDIEHSTARPDAGELDQLTREVPEMTRAN